MYSAGPTAASRSAPPSRASTRSKPDGAIWRAISPVSADGGTTTILGAMLFPPSPEFCLAHHRRTARLTTMAQAARRAGDRPRGTKWSNLALQPRAEPVEARLAPSAALRQAQGEVGDCVSPQRMLAIYRFDGRYDLLHAARVRVAHSA